MLVHEHRCMLIVRPQVLVYMQMLCVAEADARQHLLACLRLKDDLLANCALDTLRCPDRDSAFDLSFGVPTLLRLAAMCGGSSSFKLKSTGH